MTSCEDVACPFEPSKGAACPVRLATGVMARLRGLLGTRCFDGQLLLAPCRDVHTFGMRYAIDVAFIDGTGTVLAIARAVEPGRRVRCSSACAVLERQACEDRAWYEVGERIAVSPVR